VNLVAGRQRNSTTDKREFQLQRDATARAGIREGPGAGREKVLYHATLTTKRRMLVALIYGIISSWPCSYHSYAPPSYELIHGNPYSHYHPRCATTFKEIISPTVIPTCERHLPASSKVTCVISSPYSVTDTPIRARCRSHKNASTSALARVCELACPDDWCVSHALALHGRLLRHWFILAGGHSGAGVVAMTGITFHPLGRNRVGSARRPGASPQRRPHLLRVLSHGMRTELRAPAPYYI